VTQGVIFDRERYNLKGRTIRFCLVDKNTGTSFAWMGVRATGPVALEDEIAREAKRWWEEPVASPSASAPVDDRNTLDPRYRHASAEAKRASFSRRKAMQPGTCDSDSPCSSIGPRNP